MTKRWQRPPTTAPQSATRRTYDRVNCRMGQHKLTATFRAGEQLCLSCGAVFYCAECLTIHHVPAPTAHRLYPVPCSLHRRVEVQG
jgi:hypothetical protein